MASLSRPRRRSTLPRLLRRRRVRIETDRFLTMAQRFLWPLTFQQQLAKVAVCQSHPRIQLDGAAKMFQRQFGFAEHVASVAEVVVCQREVRMMVQGLAEQCGCLDGATLLHEYRAEIVSRVRIIGRKRSAS